jgi:hypothetical protein
MSSRSIYSYQAAVASSKLDTPQDGSHRAVEIIYHPVFQQLSFCTPFYEVADDFSDIQRCNISRVYRRYISLI